MIFGKLEVHLRSAALSRDVKTFGQMNPYVVLKLGDLKKTSAANQGGGKYPKWCDQIQFHKTKETQLQIEVFNLRKLGLFENDLIGSCVVDLNRFQQAYNAEETIPLQFEGQAVGTIQLRLIFTPDVEVGFIQGQLVQSAESPLDVTLRVISAQMTRDTQWFGQMSSYYLMSCGDRKFTSAVCNGGGKNPQWADKFSFVKRSDQQLSIDIQNQNNKTSIGYCTITHQQLMDGFRPGIRTIPLIFEGQQAGQILIDVFFNSLPGQNNITPPVLAPAAQNISVNIYTSPSGEPGFQPQQPTFMPSPPGQQFNQNCCQQQQQVKVETSISNDHQQQVNSYGIYPSLPTSIQVQPTFQPQSNPYQQQAPIIQPIQQQQNPYTQSQQQPGFSAPYQQQNPYQQQPMQPPINFQVQFQPPAFGNPQFIPQQPGQNGFYPTY